MFDLAHMFNYAQMMAMPQHPVPIQPISMSMVLYQYKELTKIMEQVLVTLRGIFGRGN
jgi:hypothetical protein